MKSKETGENTLDLEITRISKFGFCLKSAEDELYLPYDEFPWFRNAKLGEIINIKRIGADHLFWPDLDVDLTIDIIKHPSKYPLISKGKIEENTNQIVVIPVSSEIRKEDEPKSHTYSDKEIPPFIGDSLFNLKHKPKMLHV